MLGLIIIMIFALVAVVTGKKWAIMTATILYVLSVYILTVVFGLIMNPFGSDTVVTTGISGAGAALPNEVFDDSASTVESKKMFLLRFIDNILLILGWIRFGLKEINKKNNVQ